MITREMIKNLPKVKIETPAEVRLKIYNQCHAQLLSTIKEIPDNQVYFIQEIQGFFNIKQL